MPSQETSEYTEDTRKDKDSSRTNKMVVLYCVCVCWIQCFDLPRVTASFWLLIGLTGSFLNQDWDPEGSSQDPAATLHFVSWGQQWMKSSQHTAYRENVVILSKYLLLCSKEERKVNRINILCRSGDLPVAEDSRPILLLESYSMCFHLDKMWCHHRKHLNTPKTPEKIKTVQEQIKW